MSHVHNTQAREADWRQEIGLAASPLLTGASGVVVRASKQGPEVVSRVYNLADYGDSHTLHRVVAGQQTRHMNEDPEARNHYAVHRYKDGTVVVYTGLHSILCEVSK